MMAKRISASVGKGGKSKPRDTSGQVTATDSVDELTGNPPASHLLQFDAPTSSNIENVVVAFPIGDEYTHDPAEFGPATSLDFSLDVLAEPVIGTSHVDVTLVVLQDEFFISRPDSLTPMIDGTEGGWMQLSHSGLEARDFLAASGNDSVPDFTEPFQFAYAFHASYSTTALSVELRLDNMEATVNTVPEPCCGFSLIIAMGASVLWHRLWPREDH